jgi:hypothetical protein
MEHYGGLDLEKVTLVNNNGLLNQNIQINYLQWKLKIKVLDLVKVTLLELHSFKA